MFAHCQLVARWSCVACMYASIAATEKHCCAPARIFGSMDAILMNFIPSRSYFQDQQICTFRFFVRIPYPSLGRQNYIAPNAHIHNARKHAVHGRHALYACVCCGKQQRWRKSAKFPRSLLYAERLLGRYSSDPDNFFTSVLRNSRRTNRYVARVCAMCGTCTRSTKP